MVHLTCGHRRVGPSCGVTPYQRVVACCVVLLDANREHSCQRWGECVDCAVDDIECCLPFVQSHFVVEAYPFCSTTVVVGSAVLDIEDAVRSNACGRGVDTAPCACCDACARTCALVSPVGTNHVGGAWLRDTGSVEGVVDDAECEVTVRTCSDGGEGLVVEGVGEG